MKAGIKYGTSDLSKITLIKNGLSIGLANLIIDNYKKYIEIDTTLNIVSFEDELIDKMIENSENDILIFEAKYNAKLFGSKSEQ